ncbi:ZIP family metal transporter [Brevibacillus borstelensis]|uniref:ZIP family metal transporter n=1 Tax=Brevibacillus borstelensis TaxID=45462 RepID=UPI0004F2B3A9|nr:ZIP family metal transporter [Brevibacillus borstelensis]KKX52651.1 divalent heavy-metal cations transporter [Brevibacillus borstelensis cifa_chp40]
MQPVILVVLLSAAAASSIGGFLLCLRSWSEKSLFAMISAGAGLLLAITLLDLLPHTLHVGSGRVMPFVLIGFSCLFLLDWMGHAGENNTRAMGSARIIGVLSGFLLHSYVEGITILASFWMDERLGWSVLFAMLLHKVPDGVTVASLLLAVTRSRKKAFWGAAGLGAATLAGALSFQIAEPFLQEGWVPVMMALTTGVFLYVSASHLVPFILHERKGGQGLFFFAGMVAYLLLMTFFHSNAHLHA